MSAAVSQYDERDLKNPFYEDNGITWSTFAGLAENCNNLNPEKLQLTDEGVKKLQKWLLDNQETFNAQVKNKDLETRVIEPLAAQYVLIGAHFALQIRNMYLNAVFNTMITAFSLLTIYSFVNYQKSHKNPTSNLTLEEATRTYTEIVNKHSRKVECQYSGGKGNSNRRK